MTKSVNRLAAAAASLLLSASAFFMAAGNAEAADGVCQGSYAALLPGTPGYAYISERPSSVAKAPVPMVYRDGFTNGKAAAVEVPAGHDAYSYYLHISKSYNTTGSPPHYQATATGASVPYGTDVGHTLLAQILKNTNYIWLPDDMLLFADRIVVTGHTLDPFRAAYDANYSPDVSISDARVLELAQANSAKLTEATRQRLSQYANAKKADYPFLDLAGPVTTHPIYKTFTYTNPQYYSSWTTQGSVECGTFVEMVRHPRLSSVAFLKSYLQTNHRWDLSTHLPTARWLVTYAPVVVGPSYKAPNLKADSVQTDLVTPVTVDVLANDERGSDPLQLTAVTQPPVGSAKVQGGRVVFTPAKSATQVGTFTLTYTASDGKGTFTSTLAVTVVNRTPTLVADEALTNHRFPVTLNVLANDTDSDGPSALRVTSVSNPSSGSVQWNQNGTVTYTPRQGFIGDVVMAYVATDGHWTGSSTIRITTEACYRDVHIDAALTCSSDQVQGAADFSADCAYSPARIEQEEILCR